MSNLWKLLLIMLLSAILSVPTLAFSPDAPPPEISLGLKGGLNYFRFAGDHAKMKVLFGDEAVSPDYNPGFNAGVFGEYFTDEIYLDGKFNYGLTDIFNEKYSDSDKQPDIRNIGFSFTIGYRIFLNEL